MLQWLNACGIVGSIVLLNIHLISCSARPRSYACTGLVIIAVIIKNDGSASRVFFRQRRASKDGREFYMYTFRPTQYGPTLNPMPTIRHPRNRKWLPIVTFRGPFRGRQNSRLDPVCRTPGGCAGSAKTVCGLYPSRMRPSGRGSGARTSSPDCVRSAG